VSLAKRRGFYFSPPRSMAALAPCGITEPLGVELKKKHQGALVAV